MGTETTTTETATAAHCEGCHGPHLGFGVGEIVRNRKTGRTADVRLVNDAETDPLDCPRAYLVHYDGDPDGETFWGTDAAFEHFGEPEVATAVDLVTAFTHALDAVDAILAERVRLRAQKDNLTRIHDLVGLGVSRATEARLRDADAAIEGLDRILAALRGDA